MKLPLWLAIAAAVGGMVQSVQARERILLDQGWRFQKGDLPGQEMSYDDLKPALLPARAEFLSQVAADTKVSVPSPGYAGADFDDSGWRQLDLPHDWGVEGPFDPKGSGDTARLPYWGVAWYRRHVKLPAASPGGAADRAYLQIDGAMSHSAIWVNGQFVGGWPYGYASYQVDITAQVHPGADNVIAVRVDNPAQSSRWYPGGGIYRHVWLLTTGNLHVAHWGTYVTTPSVEAEQAQVRLRVTLEDPLRMEEGAAMPRPHHVTVRTDIFALDQTGGRTGEAVATSTKASSGPTRDEEDRIDTLPGSQEDAYQTLNVPHPKLWSTREPNRYVAVTTLLDERGQTIDVYETPFGIRTLLFDPLRGFLLNGEPLRIQGVCDHHDLGALGAALNERALRRQLEMLQAMGCNAIRTSHNPPAPELLDLCDRMGFVVMDEAFDCWKEQKRPNDYHLLFEDWHEADLRAMIRRDRNHPSVIMWSIGNEIPEQRHPDIGIAIGRELQGIAHTEDRTRPVTSACNFEGSADNGFLDVVDVFGFNYRWRYYPGFREKHPDTFLFGSETASTVSSRGVYVFPVGKTKADGLTTPDHQVSSYDLSAPRWAWPPDDEFRSEDENPGVGGEFVWTGWDYLGEPTPYGKADDPGRSSYFGIIDLAGFRKDRFYLYQARWRHDLPMAHLVPHWTWPDRVGQVTPVFVYTSGDEAELFLNGKSLGRRKLEAGQYRLRWDDVVYQPGELKVVAYRNQKRWAEEVERTAGAPLALAAESDRPRAAADGKDLVFVSVAVRDAAGVLCPAAHPEVTFRVEGPADVVAVDDGDAASFEPFQADHHRAFGGRVLAMVRPRAGAGGAIKVTATAEGLAPATVQVSSAP